MTPALKTAVRNLLLAFVLVTIGFGIGREVGRRQAAGAVPPPAGTAPAAALASTPAPAADKVVVYYLHATFRCVTCNTIEAMARDVVETQFAAAKAAGRIEWREADFQEREDLATRYGVVSSCVVVVRLANGQEAGFQRLDQVWTLVNKPTEFREYVAGAIGKYVDGGME